MSPSQPAGGKGAGANQFVQLMKRKPPAKIDGLLYFMKDLQSGLFTANEQRAVAESDCGNSLARAIVLCEALKQKAKEGPSSQNLEAVAKYLDCLSYVSCLDEWKNYTTCWSSLSNLSAQQLNVLREQGAIALVCRSEKRQLESCVGNLVSGTIRAADDCETDAF